MANSDHVNDDLHYDYNPRSTSFYQDQAWSMTIQQMESLQAQADPRRNIAPIQTSTAGLRQTTMAEHPMMDSWRYQHMQQQQQQQHQHQQQLQHQAQLQMEYENVQQGIDMSYNPYHSMAMSMPSQMNMVATTQPTLAAPMSVDQTYVQLQPGIEGMPQNWSELSHELVNYITTDIGMVSPYQHQSSSPTGSPHSHVEVLSQQSSCDEAGWTLVDHRLSNESYDGPIFVEPLHTLHNRSLSESSYSDLEQQSHETFVPNLDLGVAQNAYSPTILSDSEYEYTQPCHSHTLSSDIHATSARAITGSSLVRPIVIPSSSKASSPVRSPGSAGSAGSPGRKSVKKTTVTAKATDRVTKKTSLAEKSSGSEKRVGRRKGPLKPEQRKQASEIRKLRACLRCKFLKKTCDKGEPCAGCQPSHARLWQVPCTRIDIKDIGYFLKGRNFDYERHNTLGFSVGNLKGFSDVEKTLFITHGYGHMLPVLAREVYVRDDKCMKMDWIEANRDPRGYEVSTARMSAGAAGISTTMLSDYLDRHIDGSGTFEQFVDDYFEGTRFLSQMLKVAYQFYYRTKSRVIKKALKLMLAYNLTVHITMVEGNGHDEGFIGKIEDETSKFYGKTMAPVMINFQIKVAMADMWRELHKDVLEELSSLYSSVYSGDKLKNWPTIFILASVLLAVWECMQFDCHYRVPDEAAVDKFCSDMETTPVGVIVGLFSAISQKLPSIMEWDTAKHHALLASNPDVCKTMEQVRDHVAHHENYLRDRPNAKFDSKDFDSLSNKFLSRLVLRDIRAN